MVSQIPLFYRFILKWYEPLSSAFGVWMTLATPGDYLGAYFTNHEATWNHLYDFWFSQMAAAFFYVATSQFILFHYTEDIGVWKIINACLAGWDAILLYSYWVAFNAQDNTNPAHWVASEWCRVIMTFGVGLVRVAFVLGVGLKREKSPGKTN